MFLFLSLLLNSALAGEIIIANNTRVTYDFGSEIKPYIANEIKIVSDDIGPVFDANKFRLGFRYKVNDYIRIDPHLQIDNKRKNDWVFAPGPAIRIDLTY
tara:strand:+ start:1386 stop:1685 length:300 start_codon:yes stop_codon:yes gene_type:complete